MRIVVLAKPVPDTTGAERLGEDMRLDRLSSPPIADPNDEHAVEQALRLGEAHGGEVTLLSIAPPSAIETMRKALAMGAPWRRPRSSLHPRRPTGGRRGSSAGRPWRSAR